MWYPTTLFVSPKQGGILQSSGFLDLQSLMSLGLTCKAHALDELSLILLIENEITRHHQVSTLEGALHFLRGVCKRHLLRQWLHRDDSTGTPINPTRHMICEAVCYEVMLAKMFKTFPESEQMQIVREFDEEKPLQPHHNFQKMAELFGTIFFDMFRRFHKKQQHLSTTPTPSQKEDGDIVRSAVSVTFYVPT